VAAVSKLYRSSETVRVEHALMIFILAIPNAGVRQSDSFVQYSLEPWAGPFNGPIHQTFLNINHDLFGPIVKRLPYVVGCVMLVSPVTIKKERFRIGNAASADERRTRKYRHPTSQDFARHNKSPFAGVSQNTNYQEVGHCPTQKRKRW
jgi:Mg2+/citrate symporter